MLVSRYEELPGVYTWLSRLQTLLYKQPIRNGQWTPVASLTAAAREQIDSACEPGVEELAPIATITEPRGT